MYDWRYDEGRIYLSRKYPLDNLTSNNNTNLSDYNKVLLRGSLRSANHTYIHNHLGRYPVWWSKEDMPPLVVATATWRWVGEVPKNKFRLIWYPDNRGTPGRGRLTTASSSIQSPHRESSPLTSRTCTAIRCRGVSIPFASRVVTGFRWPEYTSNGKSVSNTVK